MRRPNKKNGDSATASAVRDGNPKTHQASSDGSTTPVYSVQSKNYSGSSVLSSESLANIRGYIDLQDVARSFQHVDRADLLPVFFRFHGEPYSMENHLPMREMFSNEYSRRTIFMAGRQIGKTLSLSRSETLDMITVPNLQVLYVAPLQDQSKRYSTLYLNEAIQSCAWAKKLQDRKLEGVLSDSKIMTSVFHKSFANGSGVQCMYAKTSADRARGIMADRIDFDEIQDQSIDVIPVIEQSLKASKYGLQRFTGTAKTVDNTIERLWQQSSQAEWVMRCPHCNRWNVPNRDNIVKMPQPDGMHCVYEDCRGLLNVRNGMWVHFNEEQKGSFNGFHVPQVVIPLMTENPVSWQLIWHDIQNLPPAIVMQEIFGISESAGARIISERDIKRQSTLPSMNVLRGNLDRYVMRICGVDWGGAEQLSFTVCTVIGVRADGRIDVLFAQRFVGIDPDVMYLQIAKAYNAYDCAVMACDYGLGFQNNLIMMNRYDAHVVQMQFVRSNQTISFKTTGRGDARWSVDKLSALRTVFMAIKYGRIYFPPYDEFEVYSKDLLSPYEHVADSSGLSTVVYMRDPARPDDFAMALTFACMAAIKINGLDLIDLIPQTAFNPRFAQGAPSGDRIDPKDFMAHE